MTGVDVLVIGGGVIGFAIALELTDAGLTVEICDRGDFGREASWAGAGILPPGNIENASTSLDRLRAYSSSRFPVIAKQLRNRTGIDIGYSRCGGIIIEPEHEMLRKWTSEKIAFEPCNDFAPWKAVHMPGMAQVRNPRLMRALIAECELRKVRLSPNCAIESFQTESHRIRSALTVDGIEKLATSFVFAAGAWTARFLPTLGLHPVRGQMVLFRTSPDVLKTIIVHGDRYLVPRGDGLILAGSTEEPEAGFEKVNTDAGVSGLRAFAESTIPSLRFAEIEATWAGLRPGTPDSLPYIGYVPGFENLLAATGHYRSGIQLSLGTARVIGDLILKRSPIVDTTQFSLDRPSQPRTKLAFRC